MVSSSVTTLRSLYPVPSYPTCSRPLAATSGSGSPAAINPHGLRNFGKLRSNSRLRPLSTQRRRRRAGEATRLVNQRHRKELVDSTKGIGRCWLPMMMSVCRNQSDEGAKKKRNRERLYQKNRARLKRPANSANYTCQFGWILRNRNRVPVQFNLMTF